MHNFYRILEISAFLKILSLSFESKTAISHDGNGIANESEISKGSRSVVCISQNRISILENFW